MRDEQGLRQAVEQFQAAIALDPDYAAAWSGLSDCYVTYYDYGLMPLAESTAAARDAAERALALDPLLSEAHTSLAHVALHAWQWPQAERSFKQALALDPQSAQAHHWYALAMTALGRLDEAVETMREARDLEPLSVIMNADYGMALYAAHRFDAAIEQEQRTLELDPESNTALWILGLSREGKGEVSEAIAVFEHALELNPGNANLGSSLAHALALAGRETEARATLDALLVQAQSPEFPAYAVAVAWVGLGDHDAAFDWLQKTIDTRSGWVRYLKVDPRLDPLRDDPRFDTLLRTIGLP